MSNAESQSKQRAFRNALGSFPTGVTIITTQDPDSQNLIGLTVNSFSSVSLDPALVLWSISRHSPNLNQFGLGRQHVIHILAETQKDIAYQFAKPGADKFAGVNYQLSAPFKAPVIQDCSARFYCETHQVLDGGDHLIIVAKVLHHDESDLLPLLFVRGTMMSSEACSPI
jgi:flavin reductase (DIM6/NTAB) family NADH-FMN oxidoreductase RutF